MIKIPKAPRIGGPHCIGCGLEPRSCVHSGWRCERYVESLPEPVAPCPECERLRVALTTTTPMRLPSGCAQADIDVGEQPEDPQS